jgi:hypothetical protein
MGNQRKQTPIRKFNPKQTTPVFKQYYRQIFSGIFMLAVESFLVVYLLINIKRRKKAEQEREK